MLKLLVLVFVHLAIAGPLSFGRSRRKYFYRLDTRPPHIIQGCKGFVCPDPNWKGRPEGYGFLHDFHDDPFGDIYFSDYSALQDAKKEMRQETWVYKVDVTDIAAPAESKTMDAPATVGGFRSVWQAPYTRITGWWDVKLGRREKWIPNRRYSKAVPTERPWHYAVDADGISVKRTWIGKTAPKQPSQLSSPGISRDSEATKKAFWIPGLHPDQSDKYGSIYGTGQPGSPGSPDTKN
ncbi:hypothetical protein MCOR31_011270 [Pyricularia oryzae]|nr:hypothetical protein MCOR31_011270 [Pyricularia oryzae]KAI6424555.1 hypothetical protein MCOR24_003319 [Pyricularia oryzae]